MIGNRYIAGASLTNRQFLTFREFNLRRVTMRGKKHVVK